MKRTLLAGLLLLSLTINVMAQKNSVTLRLVETTDVHGSFFPYDFIRKKPTQGSMARVATYVKQLRQQGDNVVLLDNGDILQGQPTCYYYNYVKTDTTNIVADITRYLQYDAETFGNHDVETGHACYDKWTRETQCPMLGANIIDTRTGEPYLKPYTIIERQGVRIAVLGMLTPAIPNWLKEPIWSGLRFEEMVSSAQRWVKIIKEKEQPDILVGLFHSGWEGGISTADYDENAVHKVAEAVQDFDVIFYGHDHTPRHETVGRVLCLDPANNAQRVAQADITLSRKDGRWTIDNKEGYLIDVRSLTIDKDYMDYFQQHYDNVQAFVSRKIGHFANTMRTRDSYFGNSAFTDFILNLQLQITGADIAFNAPLTFDDSIKAGDITVADMFNLYKYENQLYTMRLTGEEVRKHLEMSYNLWVNTMQSPDDHLLRLSARTVNDGERMGFQNPSFNFDSAAGIDYEVNVTKPEGQKVRILRMSNGEPFDEKKWYLVAVNSYRGNGGGELLTRGAGIPRDSLQSRIVWESDRDQRHYLMQEIEKAANLDPQPNTNWRFVPEAWVKPAAARDKKLLFGE